MNIDKDKSKKHSLKELLSYGIGLFRLEPAQSPFFIHGLIHFFWWITNYIPGYLGKFIRWQVGKLLLKELGKFPKFRDHVIFRDGRNVEIGDYFSCGIYSYFAGGPIKIGNNVRIANFVIIETTGHHFRESAQPICYQGIYRKSVRIDDDVWIGDRVTILGGVHIGQGSVIGAGSVVTKSIPSYSIAVGNPARIISQRITEKGQVED